MTTHAAIRSDVGNVRVLLARVITLAGMVVGALSLMQTVGHIADATYLIPALDDGAGHVHYHLARETLVTLGSFAVILLGLFAPRTARTTRLWLIMLISSVAYVAAMWSGVVVGAEAAPNAAALIVHTIASLGLVAGVILARPAYRAAVAA